MTEGTLVAAVVLAAGGSTRLRQPKQLLKLGDQPLIAHVLNTVRTAAVDERYIITGYAADRIRQEVSLDGFQEIHNPNYISGQSTSVSAVVEGVNEAVAAVIFVLGDQPLQVPGVIDLLAQSYRDEPAAIIQPEYRDGPGNPVLIDRSLFPELSQLTGDTGARPILREQRDRIRRIDCVNLSRPTDVDTWEDYERVTRLYEQVQAQESP